MNGAPDWIRTNDRPLRRRVLYPTELQALNRRFLPLSSAEVKIRVNFPMDLFFVSGKKGFGHLEFSLDCHHAHCGLRRVF